MSTAPTLFTSQGMTQTAFPSARDNTIYASISGSIAWRRQNHLLMLALDYISDHLWKASVN